MSKFTETFTYYLERDAISVASVAKASGVDRSMIQKMKAGTRHPAKYVLENFLARTSLSKSEKESLLALYEIDCIGETVYRSRKCVQRLLHAISFIQSTLSSKTDFGIQLIADKDQFPESGSIVQNSFQIDLLIRNWLNSAFHQNKKISVFIPVSFKTFFDYLYRVCLAASGNIQIRHILNFEKDTASPLNAGRNIEILSRILPVSLHSQNSYTPYYFYCDTHAVEDTFQPMPYYCCTEDSVITFSDDFHSAMFSQRDDVVRFYNVHFNQALKYTRPLLQYFPNENVPYSEQCFQLAQKHDQVSFYATLPAFASLAELQSIRKVFRHTVLDSKKNEKVNKDPFYHSFFTERGLEEFVNTGVTHCFITGQTNVLGEGERRQVLDQLVQSIEQNESLFWIIDEQNLPLADNVDCNVIHNEKAILTVRYPHTWAIIELDEVSICNAVSDFFRSVPDSDLIYSKDRALNLLAQYRKYLESQ